MADVQAPEGLTFIEEFVSPDEERDLLATIEALDFRTLSMRGQVAKRTVRMFGELVPGDALPEPLVPLRETAAIDLPPRSAYVLSGKARGSW